jgi:hypothetical protein
MGYNNLGIYKRGGNMIWWCGCLILGSSVALVFPFDFFFFNFVVLVLFGRVTVSLINSNRQFTLQALIASSHYETSSLYLLCCGTHVSMFLFLPSRVWCISLMGIVGYRLYVRQFEGL